MADQSPSSKWTPEQRAAFGRWNKTKVQAVEDYYDHVASIPWRKFCALANDAERALIRAETGEDVAFDPNQYFHFVSDSTAEYRSRMKIVRWLDSHGWTAAGPPIDMRTSDPLIGPRVSKALEEDEKEDEWENAYACPFCGLPVGLSECPHVIAYGDDMAEWVEEFEDLIPICELGYTIRNWRILAAGIPYWEDAPEGSSFLDVLERHPQIKAETVFWEGVCISGCMCYVMVRSGMRAALHDELREVCRRISGADAASA